MISRLALLSMLAVPSVAFAHPGHPHPAGPSHDHLLEVVGYIVVALASVWLATRIHKSARSNTP